MAQQMRPLARLLFPEVNGFDGQTSGFSIQYQPGIDTVLQPHTDVSSATMNINLNLPHESFSGSEVDFFDRANGNVKRISIPSVMALIHRGITLQTAQIIISGNRTNMYGFMASICTHHSVDKQIMRSPSATMDTANCKRGSLRAILGP